MTGPATFDLMRFPTTSAMRTMVGSVLDRRVLDATPGLRFWRLLGTGAGSSTAAGADLRRWAFFAVWDDESAPDAYWRGSSPVARRWHSHATERFHVRLHAAGGHGRWRGVDILDLVTKADSRPGATIGPVAVLTRADVHLRRWRSFSPARPPVDAQLQAAQGLRAVVGVGEAPIGRQATFSLWDDAAAMRRFSTTAEHREVVRRTRDERWYGEELFARFVVTGHEGTWDGTDPLHGTR